MRWLGISQAAELRLAFRRSPARAPLPALCGALTLPLPPQPLTADDLNVQGLTNTTDCNDVAGADAAGVVSINYGGVVIQNCGSAVKNGTW